VRRSSVRDQATLDESAAFFNESIIRDIITGRYLSPAIGRLKKIVNQRQDLHEDATDCCERRYGENSRMIKEYNGGDLRARKKLDRYLEGHAADVIHCKAGGKC
jgi:hypothetical protein